MKFVRALEILSVLALVGITTESVGAIEWSWTGAASFAAQAHLKGHETAEEAGLQEVDIEIEHLHLSMEAALSDRFSVVVAPCIEHEGTLSIRAAYLEAAILEKDFETILAMEAGRFYVPFGRFNYLAELTNFPSVSRPMMFASHDQDIVILHGFPRPIFMSQYSEIGLNLNGNKWFFDKHQLWYALWGGNGMYSEGYEGHLHGGDADHSAGSGHGMTGEDVPSAPANISWLQKRRFASDNNGDKAIGGRLSYGYREFLSVGASYTMGKYDPEALLQYSISGVDAEINVPTRIGKFQISGEYVIAPTEFAALSDTVMQMVAVDEYTTSGYYAQLLYQFAKKWEIVTLYDILQRDGAALDEVGAFEIMDSEIHTSTIQKISAGLNFSPIEQVKIKTEYAMYQFHQQVTAEQPEDLHRLSAAVVVSF